MIFVSVGTQLAFDRLVRSVDDWAAERCRDDVVAQIGPSDLVPRACKWFAFLEHGELRKLQEACTVMVAHAGMGSIITALELGKPIIILARDYERGEHRNGHQQATWERFRDQPGVYAATDENHVVELLDRLEEMVGQIRLGKKASPHLVTGLASFINSDWKPSLRRKLLAGWYARGPFDPAGKAD